MTVQSQVVQGVSPTPPPRMPLPVRLLGGAGLGVGLALGIIAIWSHLAGKRKETDGRPDPFSVDGDVSTAPGTPGQRSYPMLGGASALQAGPAAAHDVLRGSMDSAASVTSAEEEAAAEQERAAARLREEARLSADRADTLAQAQAGEFALKEANSRVDGLEATVMRLRDRLASEAATRMQLQGKMTSLGAARRQNQQMQATVEKLQTDLAQAEAQLRQANDRANELESYVAGLTEKASCVEQRLRELEAQQEEALVQQALQSTENVQFRMAALHHQIHEKEAELADAQLQLNIVQLSLTELEAQAGVGGAPSSHAAEALDVLRHSLEKAHERISSKRTELATLRGDLAAALAQAQHLTAAQSAEVQEVRSSLQSEVLAARADAQAARAELEEMRRKLEARAYPPVAAPAAAVPVISPQDASEETIEEDSSPTDATSAPAAANVSPDSASEEDAIEEADSLAVAESLGAAETAETDAARAEETSKDADGLAMVDSLGAAETAEMDAARAEETSKETVAKSVRQAEIEAARAEAEAARAELERIRLRMEAIQVDAAGARSSSLTSAAETSSSRDSGALPFENAEETSSTLEAQPVSGVTDHRIPTQIPVLAEAQPAADVDQPSATRASEPPRPAEQDSAAGSGPSSDALSKPSPSPNMPSMPELVPMLAVESSAADTPSLPESVLMPAVVSSAAIRLQQQIEARRDAEARLRTQIRLAQDQLREVQETVRAALGPASKKRELALRTQIRQLEADFKRAAADVGAESQMQMVTLELSQAQAALNKLYTSVTRPASLQRTAALKASILEYEQQLQGAVNQLRLVAAGLTIPHPAKMETGGEDAYFVSSIGMGAVGVADGVGSWAEDGVDPAQYPRLLMKYTEHALVEGHAAGEQATQEALAFAQEATGPLPGSCTACVALLEEGGLMRVANVGDSGFRVVRQGECIYASQVQQHEWNMPFQLASPEILPETDSAQDAEMYELQLQGGDVVVFGTDGLFDNMWDEELAAIVGGRDKAAPMDVHAASAIAGSIARAAHEHSKNTQYRSPWVIEAATKGALSFWERLFPRGGKQDDCTVVVAFVAPAVVPLSSGGGLAGKPRDESQRLQSVGR
ncbi:hypothetical protein WJX72_003722 [[Myrmecia] bisecta]|uniref:PPM-type phosphatase domain-containing protein n=1 Tax=[Myrmecia] bisecta TaxID=41462 RepID=A0AAW1QPW9_9CHLO